MRKKILIITSSGGGGLIQAANAKEQEIRAEDPDAIVVRKDVMKDWLGVLGWFSTASYNSAQRKGNVAALTFFCWAQCMGDYVFWPKMFFGALRTFFQEDIDDVIDTQPLSTSAILTALRIFNWKRKKNVCLKKIVVDLPTKKATHFFAPIKRLSKANRSVLKLITISPLLEEGETAEQFWQTNCRLSEKEVCYEGYYVRNAFRKFQGVLLPQDPMKIKLSTKSPEEAKLMADSFEKGTIQANILNGEAVFQIDPADRMITLLLGSQPAEHATLNYVKRFISLLHDINDTKIHLFVFCAEHKPGSDSLFRKVSSYVHGLIDYPKHISIIPFSFQNDEGIAPLFFRSDLTCTRSGGQTAMELMSVCKGEVWIHSEANGVGDLSLEQLLKGIPGWESANALYLHKRRGAKVVTPETFAPHAKALFLRETESTLPNPALESWV